MSDYISRQAVRLIESDSNAYPEEWNESYEKGFCDAINRVLDLPSARPDVARSIATIIENEKDMRVILKNAQPEQPSEIQDILDYLDTALHPIISPEHWNVYSELHDMISTLPSAQPERKKGKWVVYKAPDQHHCGLVECPFCGEDMIAEADEYNYCPNCGADMRGEQP